MPFSVESLHNYKVFATSLHTRKRRFSKASWCNNWQKVEFRDKASRNIQALSTIFPYKPQTQKQLLMNASFKSQFSYCHLVWMNHSVTLNNRIDVLHKRALSLVYNDFSSGFSKLLEKGKSVTITKLVTKHTDIKNI